jgi:hypothetical protein
MSYINSITAMNAKKQTSVVIAICSLLVIATSILGLTNLEALGQQQNATNATTATSNQTQAGGAGTMAALTQADFDPAVENLDSAREAIQDNNPAGAVSELGSAETELNTLMTRLGGGESAGGQQLVTVRNHLNMAQDASINNDTLKAFQGINSADTELLKITQKLPADEVE